MSKFYDEIRFDIKKMDEGKNKRKIKGLRETWLGTQGGETNAEKAKFLSEQGKQFS